MNLNICLCLSAVGHETEHWSVYRRYLEFYVLESKLTEFHGKSSAHWKKKNPSFIEYYFQVNLYKFDGPVASFSGSYWK